MNTKFSTLIIKPPIASLRKQTKVGDVKTSGDGTECFLGCIVLFLCADAFVLGSHGEIE